MLRVVRPSGLVVVSLFVFYAARRATTAAAREWESAAEPSDSSSSLSALPPLASVVDDLGVGGGASLLSTQNGKQPCLSSSVDSVPDTESENE